MTEFEVDVLQTVVNEFGGYLYDLLFLSYQETEFVVQLYSLYL